MGAHGKNIKLRMKKKEKEIGIFPEISFYSIFLYWWKERYKKGKKFFLVEEAVMVFKKKKKGRLERRTKEIRRFLG